MATARDHATVSAEDERITGDSGQVGRERGGLKNEGPDEPYWKTDAGHTDHSIAPPVARLRRTFECRHVNKTEALSQSANLPCAVSVHCLKAETYQREIRLGSPRLLAILRHSMTRYCLRRVDPSNSSGPVHTVAST